MAAKPASPSTDHTCERAASPTPGNAGRGSIGHIVGRSLAAVGVAPRGPEPAVPREAPPGPDRADVRRDPLEEAVGGPGARPQDRAAGPHGGREVHGARVLEPPAGPGVDDQLREGRHRGAEVVQDHARVDLLRGAAEARRVQLREAHRVLEVAEGGLYPPAKRVDLPELARPVRGPRQTGGEVLEPPAPDGEPDHAQPHPVGRAPLPPR